MSKYEIPTNKVSIDTTSYLIQDLPKAKLVAVVFSNTPVRLVLWKDEEYVAAGDYTQADVEARITELLGKDPAATLASLIPNRPL